MRKIGFKIAVFAMAGSLLLSGCANEAKQSNNSSAPAASQASTQNQSPQTNTVKAKTPQFKYLKAEELKRYIETKKPIQMLDIQVEDEFKKHHIKGVIPTHAYPVKTAEEKAKIDKVLPTLTASNEPIAIVCPAGGGGAERTYAYLLEKGLDENRLFILESGQKGWKFEELLEK